MNRVRFLKSEGPYLEAIVEINGVEYHVLDEFREKLGRDPIPGEEFNGRLVSFEASPEPMAEMLAANPDARVGLVQVEGWKYVAYGRIVSVDPVVAHCGVLREDIAIDSRDPALVGKYVGYRVGRLEVELAQPNTSVRDFPSTPK